MTSVTAGARRGRRQAGAGSTRGLTSTPSYAEMTWWSAVALVLPLIISERAMSPIGPLRFMLFAIFLLAFLSYFLLLRGRGLGAPRQALNRSLAVLAIAFLAVELASCLVAVNKQEAIYVTAHTVLFFLATALFGRTVLREEAGLPRLCRILTISLLVHGLVGIAQYYGIAFTELPPRPSPPYGLMANRNLFAAGLAFLFPFAGYAIYTGGRGWRILGGVSLWTGLYGIIIAQTRGAWLALAAGILVGNGLVLVLRSRLGTPFLRGWFQGMALVVLGTVSALGLALAADQGRALRDSLAQRTTSIAESVDGTVGDHAIQARFHFWRECLLIMRDYPLLGVGPGNWKIVAPNYSQPGSSNADGITTRDRAHNVYLQTGAETGMAGLALFLALWIVAASIGVRAALGAQENRRRILAVLSLGGWATFAVNAIFSFPTDFIHDLMVLALIVGIPAGMHERNAPRADEAPRSFRLSRRFLAAAVPVLGLCAWIGHAHENFEYHLKRANAFQKLDQHQAVLAEVAAGRSLLASVSPLGGPLEYYASSAYAGLGDLDQALASIHRARELNPWSVRIWNQMGSVYLKMQRVDDAIASYREALRIAPEFDAAMQNLATAYYEKKMFKETVEVLSRRPRNDARLLMMLADSHRQLGQFAGAAQVLRDGLARSPDDADALELLAYLEYNQLKDLAGAGAHLERLLVLRPNHPRRDTYSRVIELARRSRGSGPSGPTRP